MKRKLVRELALISLPLLFIAGAAWLLAGSGRALLPARVDNGPARLEFDTFEPVAVSAMDVYQGVECIVKTSVRMKGKLQVPTALKPYSIMQVWTDDYRIVYRIGKTWKRAAALSGNRDPVSQGFNLASGAQTFELNLETVPAGAEEIRFRGKFTEFHKYQGAWPAAVKPPANYSKVGKSHRFTVESKPFDVLVKAPGQQQPRPTVSRETGVSIVKASYETESGIGLRVQLRRAPKFGKPANYQGSSLISLKLIDGKGRKLDVCETAGSPSENSDMAIIDRDDLNLPDTDFIVGWSKRGQQPCGGWKKFNGPFTLEAVISDEQRWPITVKVPVPTSVATPKL